MQLSSLKNWTFIGVLMILPALAIAEAETEIASEWVRMAMGPLGALALSLAANVAFIWTLRFLFNWSEAKQAKNAELIGKLQTYIDAETERKQQESLAIRTLMERNMLVMERTEKVLGKVE